MNTTNPTDYFYENVECPDPIIYLSDDELDYLQRRVFE